MPHLKFPFLVKVDGADYLKSVAAGGEIEGAAPLDLRYGTAGNIKLNHEIKVSDYDGTNGNAVAWVSIPHLANGADTAIYQYTGKQNLSATEQAAAGVWKDYIAVWDTVDGADRSGNGHDLTVVSAPVAATLIGSAGDYSDDYFEIDAGFLNGLNAWTISFWIKADEIGSDRSVYTISDVPGNRAARNYFRFDKTGALSIGTNLFKFGYNGVEFESPSLLQSTDAIYIAITKAVGAAPVLYVNGIPLSWAGVADPTNGSAYTVPWAIPAGFKFMLGASWEADTGGGLPHWDGLIDEFRITPTARSAGWIKTEFFNQSNPGGFFGVGADADPVPAGAYDGLSGDDKDDPEPDQPVTTTDEWFQATDGLANPPAAPTSSAPVLVSTRTALHDAINTALSSAKAGQRTVIKLTADITLSSAWQSTYNFSGRGAQLIINFDGRTINCKNGSNYFRFDWQFVDDYEFDSVANRIISMTHTAGTAPAGNSTVVFSTKPGGLVVGSWFKMGCFANGSSKADADGAYPYARTPQSHRHGEEMQVKTITGNTVELTTKLYFDDRWDLITAPIYAGRLKNKFEALWLVDARILNNTQRTLRLERLVGARIIRPYFTWKTGLTNDYASFMTINGCVETRVFDPYIDRPDEPEVISTFVYGITASACKRVNILRTTASPLTYNFARLRHATDIGDSKPTSGNPVIALTRSGQSCEFGTTGTICGSLGARNDNNPYTVHANSNACRFRGALQAIGSNTSDYFISLRGVNHIIENMDMVAYPSTLPHTGPFQGLNESSSSLFNTSNVGNDPSYSHGTGNAIFGWLFRNNIFVIPSGKSLLSVANGWYGPFQFENNIIHHYGSSVALNFSPGFANGSHTGEVDPVGKLLGYAASGKEDGGLIIEAGAGCRQAASIKNGAQIIFDHFRVDLSNISSGSFDVMYLEGATGDTPASAASGTIVVNNPNNIQVNLLKAGSGGTNSVTVIEE